MDVFANRRGSGNGFDDSWSEVGWIGTRETKAPETVNPSNCTQQVSKVGASIVVAVDRLPQQRHFGGALLYQAGDFSYDI